MFRSEQTIQYTNALVLSTAKKKTSESLGTTMGVSGDTMLRHLDNTSKKIDQQVQLAQAGLDKRRKIAGLIDDSNVTKLYANEIEGVAEHYNSSNGHLEKALCTVTCMITDGKAKFPISHEFWFPKDFDPENHESKIKIAQKLILQMFEKLTIDMVVLDGLYATKEMIEWLCCHKIPFEMRFHSNRVIWHNGKKVKIKDIPQLKVSMRRHANTIRAQWNDIDLYFTVVMRINARGRTIITYQVSNVEMSCYQHKYWYDLRWNIEEFFRTAKQSLGLSDCQSRKIERQYAHITHVFLAYIFAELRRLRFRLKNVETAIKSIKEDYLSQQNHSIHRSAKIFALS